MAKNDLLIQIPTYFKCPISMEVMKSPVSLSTGITYDRKSIQKWLDGGHSTCPATMLPLSSPSFVPNLTLRRLIHLSNNSSSPSISSLLAKNDLEKVLDLAIKSEDNRRILSVSGEFLDFVARFLMNFDVESGKIEDFEVLLIILDLILSRFDDFREKIHPMIFDSETNHLTKFVVVLREGSDESKIATAKFLEKIAIDNKTKRLMIETPDLLTNLITANSDTAIEASLSAIIAISITKTAKSLLINLGAVQKAVSILCDAGRSSPVVERAIEMLELISTCGEGRRAICDDEKCVVEIVRKLMKVNEKTTEHGVTVVWSVCYLFPEEKVEEMVRKSNGLSKCLLLLQTNCSGVVKQMCRDLVKVLRVDLRTCLACYDTKTTHIMPY